jgi:hypothetical protein
MICADRSVLTSTDRVEGGRRRACGPVASIAVVICCWLWASPASSSERSAPCEGFCNPVSLGQLDKQRGQGLETAVILWDELNRRQAVPPPTNNQGMPESAAVNRSAAIAPSVILIGTGH